MKTPVIFMLAALAIGPAAAAPETRPDTTLETALLNESAGLRPEILHAALVSWQAARARGEAKSPLLSIIDYSLPSTERRMWVFDLSSKHLLFHELVAHGRNTGANIAEAFSNEDGSYMTSLGTFVTGATYDGRNGYSLRLRGLDPGINDRAEARAIVMHGAPYVNEEVAGKLGRLGRSLGCPALRPEIARTVIDEIKDGSVIFAWHPTLAAGLSH